MVIELLTDRTGDGPMALPGQTVTVSVKADLADGRELDLPSLSGEQRFILGAGSVIRGLEHALRGMRCGGSRAVRLPAALAFGAHGVAGVVPPGASLKLELRLLAADPTLPHPVG